MASVRFDPRQLRTAVLDGHPGPLEADEASRRGAAADLTTSLSLARAVVLGCVTGWEPKDDSLVEVWDPAIGEAGAASLLSNALAQVGVSVAVRGNDVSDAAVERARARLSGLEQSEVIEGDSLLAGNLVERCPADLVIIDPPWGMHWGYAASAIERRRQSGEFRFGLPPRTDSTWLFISLGLERLKDPADGGGRVSALVNKNLLSSSNSGGDVRRAVLESGQIESVVRLPEALAPNTSIPLYLMTFTNVPKARRSNQVQVMDLRTGFTQAADGRAMTREALAELAHNLEVWKPGQRNRVISAAGFTRRSAEVQRIVPSTGESLKWSMVTRANQAITAEHLIEQYGAASGVELKEGVKESVDLDPSQFFDVELRDLQRDLKSKIWGRVRLPAILLKPARAIYKADQPGAGDSLVWVPTFQGQPATTRLPELVGRQRVLELCVDASIVEPEFLAAWLNSEIGQVARRRALSAGQSSSAFTHGVPSSGAALMRWADQLIVPVPDRGQQAALAQADEQIRSYVSELERRRAAIWTDPHSADAAAGTLAQIFDESLENWLDHIPYPLATPLWTALTATNPGDVQRRLFHAWEAIVTFHATLLLSGLRTDPARSDEVERSIGRTLAAKGMTIERATFGTWVVIVEKLASEIRATLARDDPDEIARLRRSFADLPLAAIDRLASKDIVVQFSEVNSKRNRWLGHSGHVSDETFKDQNEALTADLLSLRSVVGNAWTLAPIVRAGDLRVRAGQVHQDVELVMGTRSPFQSEMMVVGEAMEEGQLYLAQRGAASPLRLSRFVHLSAAPSEAKFTSYFYSRTEIDGVRLVSYQHGTDAETKEALDSFKGEFGSLIGEPEG